MDTVSTLPDSCLSRDTNAPPITLPMARYRVVYLVEQPHPDEMRRRYAEVSVELEARTHGHALGASHYLMMPGAIIVSVERLT